MADETLIAKLETMAEEELRVKLQVLGLPTDGARDVLVDRLKKYVQEKPSGSRMNRKKSDKSSKGEKVVKDGQKSKDGRQVKVDEATDIDKLKLQQLQKRLTRMGLSSKGKKVELQKRLKEALMTDDEDVDESDDESEESDDESSDSSDSSSEESSEEEVEERRRRRRKQSPRYRRSKKSAALTFKDVEYALEAFSGDNNENVHRWINNFEENAEMCEWSDVQKVIDARRLLTGSAKVVVNFEAKIKSWKALKKLLIKEFAKTTNSKEIHEQLSAIKKKVEEC